MNSKDYHLDLVNKGVNVHDLTDIMDRSYFQKGSLTDPDRKNHKRKTVKPRNAMKLTQELLGESLMDREANPKFQLESQEKRLS